MNPCTRIWTILLIAAILVGAAGCSKSRVSRLSHRGIVTGSTQKVISDFAQVSPQFPAKLASDRDVYLLLTAEPTHARVRLIARESVPPKELAGILEDSVRGTLFSGEWIKWSKARGFSGARVVAKWTPALRTSGAFVYPVGAIVQRVKSQRLIPHVLLTTPKDLRVPGYLPRHEGRTVSRYDLTTVPQDYSIDVTWKVSAQEHTLALLFYGVLPLSLFLVVSLFGFLKLDQVEWSRWLLRILLLSIPVHWVASYVLIRFSVFPSIAEVWFHGAPFYSVRSTVLLDLMSLLVGFFVMVFIMPKQNAKTSISDEDEQAPDFDPEDDYVDELEESS